MDINELLKFVDESMFAKTGKRLNDLQRKVIEGALNYQKYGDIADVFEKSEGHVKDVGYELLQTLSDVFEEPVKKTNLKSVLERQSNIQVNIGDGFENTANTINCVNFNSDRPSPKANQIPLEKPDSQQNKQISKIKRLQDLGLTNEEIAELLEIPLESITSVNLEESA